MVWNCLFAIFQHALLALEVYFETYLTNRKLEQCEIKSHKQLTCYLIAAPSVAFFIPQTERLTYYNKIEKLVYIVATSRFLDT